MTRDSQAKFYWQLAPKAAGIFSIVVGTLVLLGWLFDFSLLNRAPPNQIAMKTNAAICFLLAGAALWLQSDTVAQNSRLWNNTARFFIAVMLLIAASTLYEHLSGIDIGIDQLLFREAPGAFGTLAQNRMTSPATVSFLLIGCALALNTPTPTYKPWSRFFAVLATFPAMTSLLEIMYGLPAHYGIGHVTQMTVRASLTFFILAFGIIASHPQQGVLGFVRTTDIGGLFARRLLPAALLLPPLFGGLSIAGARLGFFEIEFGLVITATIHMFVFSVLILSSAKSIQSADTRRKRSEQLLRARDEQFYNAFNVSSNPVMILAEDGEVIAINEMWTRLTGYRQEEIPTFGEWTRRAYRGNHAEMRDYLDSLFTKERGADVGEFEILTKFGDVRIWEFNIAPMGRHVDGRRLMMESASDITDRRQVEKTLHVMSMAIEQSPAAVMIADFNGKIEYVNPQFTRLTGFTSEEVLGRSTGILKSRAQSEEFYREITQTVLHGRVWQGEIRSQKKDGELYWEQVSATPITDTNGKITNFVTIKENISERKRVEEALLIRKQQLTGLYAVLHSIREEERRRFSRELHDELGQMLTALRMDLNWLETSLSSGQSPVLAKLATMNVLLDQTVDSVRRISEDLRPGMLDSLGLAPAIENYVGKFSTRTGIPCNLQISGEDFALSSKISIVIFRIAQEALNNAAKYANATRISLKLEQRQHEIVLVIQDNGRGLPESDEKKKSGFGILGMRERVAMLNGNFTITSSPGKGVCIEATVPIDT
jgi:PAS domain S-box-containing protein